MWARGGRAAALSHLRSIYAREMRPLRRYWPVDVTAIARLQEQINALLARQRESMFAAKTFKESP